MPDPFEEWARRIEAGDRRAVASAISAVEGNREGVVPLLKRLFLGARRALVIGVTGAPGTGKSTLAGRLAVVYRGAGHKVGILAVDPSSPFSGGAILGDRIRMQNLSGDDGIFIRSMATRGSLGGLAVGATDAVTVLEAAGCQVVIVETVGVGQDETEVARLADVTLLLLVPGMGDDVQAFKAGLMEIADVFAINKADRGGAGNTEREIRALLSLAPEGTDEPGSNGWRTPIVKTSATSGEGVEELHSAIESFRSHAQRTSLAMRREREQLASRIIRMTQQRLLERVTDRPENDALLQVRVDQVMSREADPYSVAEELVKNLSNRR